MAMKCSNCGETVENLCATCWRCDKCCDCPVKMKRKINSVINKKDKKK